jgi:hypothetical protein
VLLILLNVEKIDNELQQILINEEKIHLD